ncbi:anti-sigma factor family protein [Kyrpidia spormannii]|uniref:anti-sigma factor family protein n=1 Tax=Kyrpidia spormannii TaxID=2055160 RepID=UPI0012FFFC4B|nr:zf-HC2 domain-containing protein [Kyrpidia spormannii]
MQCREVQERLSAHLDGELPEEEETAVATHLAHCPVCRIRLAELRSASLGVHEALAAWSAPPDFEHAVNRRITALRRAKQRFDAGIVALVATGLLALMAVAAPVVAYPIDHSFIRLAGHLLRGMRILLGLWWSSATIGAPVMTAMGIGIAFLSWIAAREIIRRTWRSSSTPG